MAEDEAGMTDAQKVVDAAAIDADRPRVEGW